MQAHGVRESSCRQAGAVCGFACSSWLVTSLLRSMKGFARSHAQWNLLRLVNIRSERAIRQREYQSERGPHRLGIGCGVSYFAFRSSRTPGA